MKNKRWLWILPGILLLAAVLAICLGKTPEPRAEEGSAGTSETIGTTESSEAGEAAGNTATIEANEITEAMEAEPEPLPDSMLYYGTILEVLPDETGAPLRLRMDSPRYGPYVFLLGEDTCYVDSGEHTAFEPGELQAEDRVYVVCSPISMRSMPPQSLAFVILRNIPMDASCAMYHEAEEIRQEADQILITTDNGSLTLGVPLDADVFSYEQGTGSLTDLQEGDFFLAWYWNRGEEILQTPDIMLLP